MEAILRWLRLTVDGNVQGTIGQLLLEEGRGTVNQSDLDARV